MSEQLVKHNIGDMSSEELNEWLEYYKIMRPFFGSWFRSTCEALADIYNIAGDAMNNEDSASVKRHLERIHELAKQRIDELNDKCEETCTNTSYGRKILEEYRKKKQEEVSD